jgi:hypothetical protein
MEKSVGLLVYPFFDGPEGARVITLLGKLQPVDLNYHRKLRGPEQRDPGFYHVGQAFNKV